MTPVDRLLDAVRDTIATYADTLSTTDLDQLAEAATDVEQALEREYQVYLPQRPDQTGMWIPVPNKQLAEDHARNWGGTHRGSGRLRHRQVHRSQWTEERL